MVRSLIAGALALACAYAPTAPAAAKEPVGPALGAGTNFGQGWQADMLAAAEALGVALVRDGVSWSLVERDGSFVYDEMRTTYPELLPEAGLALIFNVNNGHPDYDGGHTPVTQEAVAAFAAHAAEAVRRFPAIVAVEVGNEMNAENFVSGPGWDVDLAERAVSYTRLLEATAKAVRAVRPEIRILGTASHSLSLTWFRALSDAGAFAHMDAIAVHPYDVPPEMLERKVAELRTVPGVGDMPLSITEIGDPDATSAPGHFLRTYCQLALAGAETYVWYPLNPRGDGLVPLVTQSGDATGVGRAYALAAEHFEGRRVVPIAPDPFTYGCRFGADAALLWGEPRAVSLHDADIRVLDATGAGLPRHGLALSRSKPIVLLAADGAGLVPGRDYRLAPQPVIADSYHQFSFDQSDAALAGWQRVVRTPVSEAPMEARPGQQRGGVPWDPHLGTALDGGTIADARWVSGAMWGGGPVEVALRHRVGEAVRAELVVDAAPSTRAEVAPGLRIARGQSVLAEVEIAEPRTLRFGPFDLTSGEVVEVTLVPRGGRGGQFLSLRAQLRHAAD